MQSTDATSLADSFEIDNVEEYFSGLTYHVSSQGPVPSDCFGCGFSTNCPQTAGQVERLSCSGTLNGTLERALCDQLSDDQYLSTNIGQEPSSNLTSTIVGPELTGQLCLSGPGSPTITCSTNRNLENDSFLLFPNKDHEQLRVTSFGDQESETIDVQAGVILGQSSFSAENQGFWQENHQDLCRFSKDTQDFSNQNESGFAQEGPWSEYVEAINSQASDRCSFEPDMALTSPINTQSVPGSLLTRVEDPHAIQQTDCDSYDLGNGDLASGLVSTPLVVFARSSLPIPHDLELPTVLSTHKPDWIDKLNLSRKYTVPGEIVAVGQVFSDRRSSSPPPQLLVARPHLDSIPKMAPILRGSLSKSRRPAPLGRPCFSAFEPGLRFLPNHGQGIRPPSILSIRLRLRLTD
jgi:hypothetical protein